MLINEPIVFDNITSIECRFTIKNEYGELLLCIRINSDVDEFFTKKILRNIHNVNVKFKDGTTNSGVFMYSINFIMIYLNENKRYRF
jgi:hypothetical protein